MVSVPRSAPAEGRAAAGRVELLQRLELGAFERRCRLYLIYMFAGSTALFPFRRGIRFRTPRRFLVRVFSFRLYIEVGLFGGCVLTEHSH